MNPSRVLLVEDDEALREALIGTLSIAGYQWVAANTAEQALVLLKKTKVDIVVSDIQMTGMNGFNLLRNVKHHFPKVPVLLMTAYANIEDAVMAMKEGACDYMAKPFAPEVLINMISRYLLTDNIEIDTIAVDRKSQALIALAGKVAITDANVLILGESGSGKEVLAKYIHRKSNRYGKSFVAINCAAIPENMLEATLFGYEKGAFTGAIQACPGKFELAQEGTILLDEISEMDLGLQAKLLRVLQEREVERLGSRKSIKLDVRVIATSNRDLRQYVQQGNFREDLYYRLNVFPLTCLALKERKDDILPLAEYLLQRHCKELSLPIPSMDAECQNKILNYQWNGNVRELDNVIQRALVLCQHGKINADHILLEEIDWYNSEDLQQIITVTEAEQTSSSEHFVMEAKNSDKNHQVVNLGGELRTQEFSIILAALKACKGRRKEVAERLGISSRTLRYKLAKMREAGITIPS